MPGQSGNLIRRNAEAQADIEIHFSSEFTQKFTFKISPKDEALGHATSSVAFEQNSAPLPRISEIAEPVFIPPKEVLTMISWLPNLYEKYRLAIDRTYPDLCRHLSLPLLRAINANSRPILEALEALMQGKIRFENNSFYLYPAEGEPFEINLIAEGTRKLGVLAYLLGNGSLTKEVTLFWDEPEANLNPALLKEMAVLLAEMARAGFQIILATHCLFLLKEFHILSQQKQLPVRYFGLSAEAGGATEVATADALTDLPNLVALDVEMAQSDAFLDVLNRDDANV